MSSSISSSVSDLAEHFSLIVRPSKIAGIGVFATRAIPEGANPFPPGNFDAAHLVTLSAQEYARVRPHVKKFIDFYGIDNTGPDGHRRVTFPRHDALMDLRFYMNHSKTPNMECRGFEFVATRDIEEGEELTHNYSRTEGRNWKQLTQIKDEKGKTIPIEAEDMKPQGQHIAKYLPHSVVEAARQRILWCYESFDCPLVSFSGGKDSLAVLLLTLEVCRPLGIKPHCLFIDEEFVPTRTLDFVKWVFYESEFASQIIPHWLCWQMESEIYCAGQTETVIQWGAKRKGWLREPPAGALMDRENVYDIFSPDAPLARVFTGKSIVSLLGVRAGESLARLTTVRHSAGSGTHPCFIRKGQTPGVYRAVPLYDWLTNDVLKFLSERNIINPIYYEMLCAGKQLRTDTPLHGRRCNIAAFKKIDPPFFDRLCKLFPQVHAAALYNESTKPLAELVDQATKKHGRGWEGLFKYVQKFEEPGKSRAEAVLRDAAMKHARLRRRGLSGIPLLRVWKMIVGRNFDHGVSINNWSKTDYAFEKKTPSPA